MSGPGLSTSDGLPWRAICEEAAAPISVVNLQGRLLYVNRALCQLFGYEHGVILRSDPQELFQTEPPTSDFIDSVLASPWGEVSRELRLLRCDGSPVWVLVSGSLVRDRAGEPLAVVTHSQDITARRETEIRWRQTFARAPIGMAQLDLRGHWTEVNAALCDLLGYSRDELLDMHYGDVAYPDEAEPALFADVLAGNAETVTVENRYRHRDGFPVWLLIRVSAVSGAEGKPAYLIGQYEEIGDRRMTDEHLAHLALHDPLTGLANRALLADRMQHQLVELAGEVGVLAVLLVDLDDLKPVNDTYGHAVGDRLLTSAADKLLNAVRPADTVARYGGDEFVVLGRVDGRDSAEAFRTRIERSLRGEIELAGGRVRLRASVGLAVTSDPRASSENLLHDADQDMYHRKRSRPRSS